MSESDYDRGPGRPAPPGGYGRPPGYASPSINEQQLLVAAGGRTRVVVIVVAVALAALALAGWRFLDSRAGSPTVPVTASGSVVDPTSHAPRWGTVLETVALQPTDLQNGYTLRLLGHGDQVAGQVTLDNCGYHFTTEKHRIARRQYVLFDSAGHDAEVSNEVVAYDSAANAALALRQWHQAALTCPHHPVTTSTAPTLRLAERITYDQFGVTALPVPDNIVTIESATAPRIGRRYLITILQVRGNILDAIYATQTRIPTATELSGALDVAAITGRRLASSS